MKLEIKNKYRNCGRKQINEREIKIWRKKREKKSREIKI